MSKSTVYVIGAESGPYKVGQTNNAARRLAAMQTANPEKLALHYVIETDNSRSVETLTHKLLDRRWKNGEWYSAPLPEVIDAVNHAAELSKQGVTVKRRIKEAGQRPDGKETRGRPRNPDHASTRRGIDIRLERELIDRIDKIRSVPRATWIRNAIESVLLETKRRDD